MTGPTATPTTPIVTPPPSSAPLPANAAAFSRFPLAAAAGSSVAITGVGRGLTREDETWGPPVDSPVTLTLQVDGSGAPTSAWVQTGSQVMSVPSAGPVRISLQSGGSAVALVRIAYPFSVMDYVRSVTFADPAAARLSYQTFGWWDGFEGSTAPHAYPDVGGFSVGAATPAGAIPTVGSAVFQGKLAAAVYARTVANPVEVAALMSLSVDFGARAATFSSTDWSDTINGVQPGTALNGRLTYSAAGGPMTGALATANGQYSGPASAQFYGPGAEEVGGAFTLAPANGGGSQVVGGFGAVR